MQTIASNGPKVHVPARAQISSRNPPKPSAVMLALCTCAATIDPQEFSFPLPKVYANVCTNQGFFDAQQNANAVRHCTSCKNRSTSAVQFGYGKSKATLRDVAKAAGVHISNASRALNSDTQHRITPDVVERVRSVAGKLGYRVNAFASSLRTKRSNTIEILIPDLWNPGFPAIVTGVQEVVSHGEMKSRSRATATTWNDMPQLSRACDRGRSTV